METITQALDRVTSAVGKIKSTEELEAYINALPLSYKSNALLKGLFQKRLTKLTTHAS
jgi:hypothetical protein